MASVAGTLKRRTLELGGNDAAIVLGDVDAKAMAPELHAGGTVWSSDLDRVYDVAARIDIRTIRIDKHLDLPPDIPFTQAKIIHMAK